MPSWQLKLTRPIDSEFEEILSIFSKNVGCRIAWLSKVIARVGLLRACPVVGAR